MRWNQINTTCPLRPRKPQRLLISGDDDEDHDQDIAAEAVPT